MGTKGKEEMPPQKLKVLLGIPEGVDGDVEELLNGVPDLEVMDRAYTREQIQEKLTEETDIIFLTTALPGSINWIHLTRQISEEIRIIALETEKLNRLVYGRMEQNGVEFADPMKLPEAFWGADEVEEEEPIDREEQTEKAGDEEESEEEDPENSGKEIEAESDSAERIRRGKKKNRKITIPSINLLHYLPKRENSPLKITPDAQVKEVVRTVETTRHHVVEKIHVQKEIITAPDYQKIVAVVGSRGTGKSFLTTALARHFDQRRLRTALLDLTDSRGLYYFFHPEEKKDKKEGGRQMEKSILELTQHKDDPWLESAGISLYTANPVIPLPEITGMNFMAMTKRVMGEHHISMAELRAPANIEEEYSFLECLMICHQVIFLWDTDPLRQEEQLALFQRITEVVDLPRILVCINLYTRRGMGKHKIRRLLEKVAGTLGSIYTLEWSREDIEQARLCLCGGQFQLHKMSPKTLTAIEEVGNRIFPASSKKPRKRRKKG